MRALLPVPFLCGLLLVASACGDDSSSEEDALPLEELPAGIASVFCGALTQCFGELLELFPSPDCEANLQKQFENEEFPAIQAAVEAGTARYDGTKAPACLRALEQLGCDIAAERSLPACEAALAGTIALGDACSVDAECEGDAFCDVSEGTCPGTCAELRREGESCESDSACINGLSCTGATCEREATQGQPCGGADGGACRIGLICRGETETDSGTCANADTILSQDLEESCSPDGAQLCKAGLSCVYTGSEGGEPVFVCREKVASGADCSLGFPEQCPDGEYCDVDITTGVTEGSCVALPGAGETCLLGEFRTSPCARGLSCLNGECKALKENGATCGSQLECYGGRCLTGQCQGADFCTD